MVIEWENRKLVRECIYIVCWVWYNNFVFFYVCVCFFVCFYGCFVFVWLKFERFGYFYYIFIVFLVYVMFLVRGNKGVGM